MVALFFRTLQNSNKLEVMKSYRKNPNWRKLFLDQDFVAPISNLVFETRFALWRYLNGKRCKSSEQRQLPRTDLTNFTKCIRKHLCFSKVGRPAALLNKRIHHPVFFLEFCKILRSVILMSLNSCP